MQGMNTGSGAGLTLLGPSCGLSLPLPLSGLYWHCSKQATLAAMGRRHYLRVLSSSPLLKISCETTAQTPAHASFALCFSLFYLRMAVLKKV